MLARLSEEESVTHNGENYSTGDKVYSSGQALFGVGEILEIEIYGVGFGFRALIDSCILDRSKWYDARCLQKNMPDEYSHFKQT